MPAYRSFGFNWCVNLRIGQPWPPPLLSSFQLLASSIQHPSFSAKESTSQQRGDGNRAYNDMTGIMSQPGTPDSCRWTPSFPQLSFIQLPTLPAGT